MRGRSMAASPAVVRRSIFSPTRNSQLHLKDLPRAVSRFRWFYECPPSSARRRLSGLVSCSSGTRGGRASASAAVSCTSSGNSPAAFSPFVVDVSFLACSMPGRRLKVAVLVSGGVDSSVALRLLHAAGHACTAFYLKIWFQEDFENFWSECPWDEDLKYAKAVCDQIGVPLEVVHLTDEYWNNVVSHIISEYRCGRTPNPDVLCNTRIKFGAFLNAIESMNFDYVASGHYARVLHPTDENGDSILKLSCDTVKDQTYFLSNLSQSQLKRLLFPLGNLPKEKVRGLASAMNLPNKDRKDSQGICFLGKVKFSEFVAKHIGEREGVLLEAETGDFLGNHRGFWFYTIGQRQGLRLPGGPWYVVEKDVENNVVFVSRNYFSVDKRRRVFRVGSLKWINGLMPQNGSLLRCKVRHGPVFYDCTITIEPSNSVRDKVATSPTTTTNAPAAIVRLSQDDQGLAAGQFAAFYDDSTCIGSGVILESWDDHGFPICPRALELAKLADKSKLGSPVKIVNQLNCSSQPLTDSLTSCTAVAAVRDKKLNGAAWASLAQRFGCWRHWISRWL